MQTRTQQRVLRSENKPFAEFILMFSLLFCFVGQNRDLRKSKH